MPATLLGLAFFACFGGCTNLEGLTSSNAAREGVDAAPDATMTTDASLTEADVARPTTCRWNAPFASVRAVLSPGMEDNGVAAAQLSPDERVVYFQVLKTNETGYDLFRAERNDRASVFDMSLRTPLAELNDPTGNETNFAVRADGLLTVFSSNRGDAAMQTLYTAQRGSLAMPFSTPTQILTLGVPPEATSPFITKDGSELWFAVASGTARSMYVSPITAVGFGAATPRPDVPGWIPVLSDDKLTIYYALGQSSLDNAVRVAHRNGPLEPFAASSLVSEVNQGGDAPSWLSPDQCSLYITSRRDGKPEVLVAERTP